MYVGRYIFIFIFIILISESVIGKKKGRKGRKVKTVKIKADKPGKSNGKCVKMGNVESAIRLRCGSKDVIYSIDIKSYNGSKCDETDEDVCSGLQPTVLTDSNLCYSRRQCIISFSNRAPIVKTANASCIGKTPAMLEASYRCVRKDLFHAMYKSGYNRSYVTETVADLGMLVSHDTFPWHYDTGLYINMTLKPKSKNKRRLYISVPVMELDVYDMVEIVNYNQSQNGMKVKVEKTSAGEATLIHPSTESKTVVKFATDNNSSAAKGFIICYLWAGEEDLSKVDICTRLKGKRRKRKPGKSNKPQTPKKPGERIKKNKKDGKKKRKAKRTKRTRSRRTMY